MIHTICDRIVSFDGLLNLTGRTDFSVASGREDGATNGDGPDPRGPGTPRERLPAYRRFNAVQDEKALLLVRSHNFH